MLNYTVISIVFSICGTSLLEAGVLKENPPGFWPKIPPPRPREGAVVVAGAGAGVPKEKPPVLAAGALYMQKVAKHSTTANNYSHLNPTVTF